MLVIVLKRRYSTTGDSIRAPIYPLFGGHDSHLKQSRKLTIPKRAAAELPGILNICKSYIVPNLLGNIVTQFHVILILGILGIWKGSHNPRS